MLGTQENLVFWEGNLCVELWRLSEHCVSVEARNTRSEKRDFNIARKNSPVGVGGGGQRSRGLWEMQCEGKDFE